MISGTANGEELIHMLKLREAVDDSVDEFSGVWYPDEFTNLRRRLQDTKLRHGNKTRVVRTHEIKVPIPRLSVQS